MKFSFPFYLVADELEVDTNGAELNVSVLGRLMNLQRNFLAADFRRLFEMILYDETTHQSHFVAEDEEQRVDDIGAICTHDA